MKNSETSGESYSLTAQLLILYYLLLYEDVRLTNAQTISSSGRKVLSYSTEFLSELPIKYLLHKAEEDQQSYGSKYCTSQSSSQRERELACVQDSRNFKILGFF